MIELHVWGFDSNISIISPESIASAWIMDLVLKPRGIQFAVVTSCNTNLASSGQLPVLFVELNGQIQKYEGYQGVCCYVSDVGKDRCESEGLQYILEDDLESVDQKIANMAMESMVNDRFHTFNLYNLYINSNNYEKYTRKLFPKFFPFPMMYNQSLTFYRDAEARTNLLGFTHKTGFFSIASRILTAQTEYLNEEDEESQDDQTRTNPKGLSLLHEKHLLNKAKEKESLSESKNSMRLLSLLESDLRKVKNLFKQLNPESDSAFSYLYSKNCLALSEVLFLSYLYCLTSADLPDRVIDKYLSTYHSELYYYASTVLEKLNKTTLENGKEERFRSPKGCETPSLLNEIGYQVGLVKY